MCPCNLSFDHGATYDFCRVTLVFNVREGQVEGADIGGLKVAAIADTPEGDDRRQLAPGCVRRRPGDRRAVRQAGSGVQRAARWTDGGAGAVGGRSARGRASGHRGRRRRAASQRPRRRRDRLRDRGHRARSVSRPASRFGSRACSIRLARTSRWPRRSDRGSTPSASQYEGKTGLSTSEFSWAA